MDGHRIEWTIEPEVINGRVYCDTPDADCHLTCSEGCESFSLTSHQHPLRLAEQCNVAEWINLDCPTLTYAGDEHPLLNGPIVARWAGDFYLWQYPAAQTDERNE